MLQTPSYTQNIDDVISQTNKIRVRAPNKCSKCNQIGHNRNNRKCSMHIENVNQNIEEIDYCFENITSLRNLVRFTNLRVLKCSHNKLRQLPELPNNLEILECDSNELTSLPQLNHRLEILDCSINELTSLPKLNYRLQELFCSSNQLTSLPRLNERLHKLDCHSNNLNSLPRLNKFLRYLFCSSNQLTMLPKLNNKLRYLFCSENQLTSLPRLNDNLRYLAHNNLILPNNLNKNLTLMDDNYKGDVLDDSWTIFYEHEDEFRDDYIDCPDEESFTWYDDVTNLPDFIDKFEKLICGNSRITSIIIKSIEVANDMFKNDSNKFINMIVKGILKNTEIDCFILEFTQIVDTIVDIDEDVNKIIKHIINILTRKITGHVHNDIDDIFKNII